MIVTSTYIIGENFAMFHISPGTAAAREELDKLLAGPWEIVGVAQGSSTEVNIVCERTPEEDVDAAWVRQMEAMY